MKRKLLLNSMLVVAVVVAASLYVPTAFAQGTGKAWAGNSTVGKSLTATATPVEPASQSGSIAVSASAGSPKKSPTGAIKDLDGMLDDFKTDNNLSDTDEEHNRKLKMKIIHGTFDVRELSKLSLSKHWKSLTPEQRQRFVDLMVSLLEEKALFSKEQSAAKSKQGGKYKVLYRGHKYLNKNKSKSFVRTKVLVPSENVDINLNYKLRSEGGEWKIYDVIVDEASLVSNYKYQFNSIITKHSYDELVRRMSKKLDEIKGKRCEE